MKRAMLCKCPRCGEEQLEKFSTHSYCSNCNYSDDRIQGDWLTIPQWVFDYLKSVKPKSLVDQLITANPAIA